MKLPSIFKRRPTEKSPEVSTQPTKMETAVAIPAQKEGAAKETPNEKPQIKDPVEAVTAQNMDVIDVIAPASVEIDMDYLKINNVYFRTLFISGYPRFVSPGWLEQIINFNSSLDISFFIYPVEARGSLMIL